MSESLPPRKTQGKSFILSIVAVLALSLFRLWSDFADETVPPSGTIVEHSQSYHTWSDVAQGTAPPSDNIVEQAHESKPSPFSFPDVNTTDRMKTFSNLTDLVPSDINVEQTHGNKVSPFWGAFPDVNTTDTLESFSNLTDLVQLQNLPVPRNLNILIMADSVSRYQYLDLVYFLSHNGTFPSPDDRPNMVVENTHKDGWIQYFNFTNSALRPYEQCDCFRAQKFDVATLIENRYFHDPERNNYVTYLQKFGAHPFKSSWNVSDVHNKHELVQDESELNFIYKDAGWVETIRDYVCQISPKPSLFIFNAGLWKRHDLTNVELQHKIIEALQACEIRTMFKTTTKSRSQFDPTWAEYERQLCNLTDYCMDVRWTALVPKQFYVDDLHFLEPVYSLLNVQLLSMITSTEHFPKLQSYR